MSQFSGFPQAAVDYNSTIIGALELSAKKWVLAVQLPGVSRHSRHVLDACGDGLVSFVERLKARCAAAGGRNRLPLSFADQRRPWWRPFVSNPRARQSLPVCCSEKRGG